MTTDPTTKTGSARRILGLGALACLACCIGPVLGLLGAIGIATIAGTVAFGIAGLTIALLTIPVLRKHRRRSTGTRPLDEQVAVAAPSIHCAR